MKWKYVYEGTTEDGLRGKNEGYVLTAHLPTNSASDVIRYYMIQSFPSNGFLVQKIDTSFIVIDWLFFLNTLSYEKASNWSAMWI